ncbi:DUF4352 domain-containing protein [Streptomyces sp. NPDC050585]|uniref:DUF4352 domain-containing protein n=1 Tax=Streptomyces sp. NPDC050585 TaxID=3365632 RepID=UPI00379CD99A
MHRALPLLLIAGVLTAGVACGDTDVETTPASPPAATAPGAPTATTPAAPPTPPTPSAPRTGASVAAVGDTLDLEGIQEGEALAVTVVKVVDPARPDNEFSSPDADERYVAVQFRLRNTGTAVYDDSPHNGATLVDTQGQSFAPTITEVAAGPGFPGSVTVPPGDTALGYVVFAVPQSSKVAKVQFAMDSGFSQNVGQWRVAR